MIISIDNENEATTLKEKRYQKMKIKVEGIKLKKALEFVDRDADIELFHKREDDLYDIKIIGFDHLDYIIPVPEKTKSFVALTFYDTSGVPRHIFFELDEYIHFVIE